MANTELRGKHGVFDYDKCRLVWWDESRVMHSVDGDYPAVVDLWNTLDYLNYEAYILVLMPEKKKYERCAVTAELESRWREIDKVFEERK